MLRRHVKGGWYELRWGCWQTAHGARRQRHVSLPGLRNGLACLYSEPSFLCSPMPPQ